MNCSKPESAAPIEQMEATLFATAVGRQDDSPPTRRHAFDRRHPLGPATVRRWRAGSDSHDHTTSPSDRRRAAIPPTDPTGTANFAEGCQSEVPIPDAD